MRITQILAFSLRCAGMAKVTPSPQRAHNVPTTSKFDQTWSPSATHAFDASTLAIARAPRAWERKAEPPREKDARFRKVWRRYGLRSVPGDSESADVNGLDARQRAVKRMCINDVPLAKKSAAMPQAKAKYAGTKYDRRKSGVTSMHAAHRMALGHANESL